MTTQAFVHGVYVGATGSTRKLRELRNEAVHSNLVEASWRQVGKSMRKASKASKTR